MEKRIKASIDLIARQPEYTGVEITSEIKQLTPQMYEVNIYTPLTTLDDKRLLGNELREVKDHLKTYNNISVNFHQYSPNKNK